MHKRLSDERLLEIIKAACERFEGNSDHLQMAIGALCWARVVGWQAVRLCHSHYTFTRFEDVLGVKFSEELPERTDQSERMRGIRLLDSKAVKFWQAITAGMFPAKEASKVRAAG